MNDKPRLLIISAVYPFPRNAGQQQRVYYKLRALRENFHLTFLTFANQSDLQEVEQKLSALCDAVIVLPSLYMKNIQSRIFYKIAGLLYTLFTGLKFSNYLIGELEFSQKRLAHIFNSQSFECVLYEYWHSYKTTVLFRQKHTPSLLDMHDILWRSYEQQLSAKRFLPVWFTQMRIKQYKHYEESAWGSFDMLIAINEDEREYARSIVGPKKIFYAPMGTDISEWVYSWQPAQPARIAYYGSLGSSHNQQDALLCYREIMPVIWKKYPNAEFWIVGNNPPDFILQLAKADFRVMVTGFVEHVQDVLNTMTLVICPWSGTYGFRSRIVEVMSLGVPVIASPDSIYGMGFEIERGIFIGSTPAEMGALGVDLLNHPDKLEEQSRLARQQVEEKFSYEATYLNFAGELAEHIFTRKHNMPHE